MGVLDVLSQITSIILKMPNVILIALCILLFIYSCIIFLKRVIYGNANLLYFMLITFGPPFWSDFHSKPVLYANIPDLYSKIFPLYAAVSCRARGAQMRGGGGHMSGK